MTGKAGSYNTGLLNMVADRTSYINDDDELVKIPLANFSVLRIQRDIVKNSLIGFIGLNKESLDDNEFNRNLGIDANIFLKSKTQISGFLPKSFSPGIKKNGYAAYGDFYSEL